MHDFMTDTPEKYAKRICYIKDASTIRARTMDEFGRAPSLEWIKSEQAEAARLRSKPHNTYQTERYDDMFASIDRPFNPPKPRAAKPFIQSAPPITHVDVVRQIAARFGITYDELIGRDKSKRFLHPRYLAIAVLVHRFQQSSRCDIGIYKPIGRIMGDRDHSTIMNAWDRWPALRAKGGEIAKAYDELTAIS